MGCLDKQSHLDCREASPSYGDPTEVTYSSDRTEYSESTISIGIYADTWLRAVQLSITLSTTATNRGLAGGAMSGPVLCSKPIDSVWLQNPIISGPVSPNVIQAEVNSRAPLTKVQPLQVA